jgi:hypothetical protein
MISLYFEDNRKQSIQSLQFLFFLKDFYFSLLKKSDTENIRENILIQEFVEAVGKNYYWQLYKISDYRTLLRDFVFWESSQIYLTNMEKFAAGELSGLEFVNRVYYTILADKKDSKILETDFERQATLELNSEIFQFSKVIGDFEFVLSIFDEEPEIDEDEEPEIGQSSFLTEDQLREIIKKELPKIQKYFIDRS